MVTGWKLRLSIIGMGMFKLLLSQNLVFDFYLEDIPSLKCLGKICFCVSYNVTPLVKMFHGLMGSQSFKIPFFMSLGLCRKSRGAIKPSLIIRVHSTESKAEEECLTGEHQSLSS